MEEAFKRVPEGVQKQSHSEILQRARAKMLELMGTVDEPSLQTIMDMVATALHAGDSAGVLRWEGRLDEMLFCIVGVETQIRMLRTFAMTNFNDGHFAKAASSFQRCVPRCGKMGHIRDQATTMSEVGNCYMHLNDMQPGAFEGAAIWYEKARKLGEQHGFYSTVSKP